MAALRPRPFVKYACTDPKCWFMELTEACRARGPYAEHRQDHRSAASLRDVARNSRLALRQDVGVRRQIVLPHPRHGDAKLEEQCRVTPPVQLADPLPDCAATGPAPGAQRPAAAAKAAERSR